MLAQLSQLGYQRSGSGAGYATAPALCSLTVLLLPCAAPRAAPAPGSLTVLLSSQCCSCPVQFTVLLSSPCCSCPVQLPVLLLPRAAPSSFQLFFGDSSCLECGSTSIAVRQPFLGSLVYPGELCERAKLNKIFKGNKNKKPIPKLHWAGIMHEGSAQGIMNGTVLSPCCPSPEQKEVGWCLMWALKNNSNSQQELEGTQNSTGCRSSPFPLLGFCSHGGKDFLSVSCVSDSLGMLVQRSPHGEFVQVLGMGLAAW